MIQSSLFLPEEQTAFYSESHSPEVDEKKNRKNMALFIANSQRHPKQLHSHSSQSGVMDCSTSNPYPQDEKESKSGSGAGGCVF